MLNKIKSEILNFGLKFINVDEKIVRMILETSTSNVNEIVILPAIKMVMKKLVNKLDHKITHGRVYNGKLNGVRVSVIRSQIGCPNAALVMESLKRCKTKVVIRIDFCGGVKYNDQAIEVGDIIIPNSVYCDEGTSPHYVRTYPLLLNHINLIKNPLFSSQNMISGNNSVIVAKPNENLSDILKREALNLMGERVRVGKLWTTDALFCEDFKFIRSLQTLHISGIDMESSIIFLLGLLFNLKCASILSISDLPGHPQYDFLNSNEIHPNMEIGIDNTVKILIKSLPKIKSIMD
jgi:nucleoside phosphorylase